MKKHLKTLAILLTGYTIGETITVWRMQPQPLSFRDFVKKDLAVQKQAFADAAAAGAASMSDPRGTGERVKTLFFKDYPLK